ncbi:MAG: serine/threonine protein kinase, partial [Thermoflexales bacterium]|nr:serine/threonine protein kinase [Thermoflexales bacterium]MDW8352477.1 serine/threonine protein kinase [Anaerolineae bacterium]
MKPQNIGRYQIKAELNRGGMSVVYLAYDPNIGRNVAIKVLPRSLSDQAAARERFVREVRAVVQLDHPAIVPIYDFGEEDGQPYIVMRYMPGGSLADVLSYGRLNLADANRVLQRMAQALDAAHKRKIIHRDLKPGNILFDNYGEAFLSDFGIVKTYEAGASAPTLTGSVVLGTPAYMSPEQALGKRLDERSDVYSLGAVLYEMLTGMPPYKGPTGISVAMKHVMEAPPDLRQHRPDLPEACIAVVQKAMAKEPDARFASVVEMADAFAAAVASATNAEPMMPPLIVRRKPRMTSKAAALYEPSDQPAVTTELQLGQASLDSRFQRAIAYAVVSVATLFAVAVAIFFFAIAQRSGSAAQQTPSEALTRPVGRATATSSSMANTPAALTSPTAPSILPPTDPPVDPTHTPTPEAVRLRVNQLTNVRAGPGIHFPVIAQMQPGTELSPFSVTQQPGGEWYLIRLHDGRIGYMFAGVLEVLNPAALPYLPTVVVVVPPTITPAPVTPSPTPTASPTPT